MRLETEQEVANTRRKLKLLEDSYQEALNETDDDDERVRELELQSLRRLINQLKEEVARYEARRFTRR
jgi:hypothetical protein